MMTTLTLEAVLENDRLWVQLPPHLGGQLTEIPIQPPPSQAPLTTRAAIHERLQTLGLLATIDFEEEDLPPLSEEERAEISRQMPHPTAFYVEAERAERA